jgi:hypothetical protein
MYLILPKVVGMLQSKNKSESGKDASVSMFICIFCAGIDG